MSDEAMLMDLGIDVTESSRQKYELERDRCVHCGERCDEVDDDFDERVCQACQAQALSSPEPEEPEPEEQFLIREDQASPSQLVCYAALFFAGFTGLVHTFIHPSIGVTVAVALIVTAFGTHRVHHAHSFAG